jgi:DNA repair protein RecO (recombination protein O)
MADYHRTKGFVIAKRDFREADQIFSVYTKDFGKLEILGRAIRKIKSKLRVGIDVFYFSEIEFVEGRAYKTLTDSLKIDRFDNIRNDIEKIRATGRIIKTVNDLIHSSEKDDRIFALVEETLDKLDNSSCRNPAFCQLVYYCFFWNFVSLLGYQINLYSCACCRKKLCPESIYFNFKDGGIVCADCSDKENCKTISSDIIKILRIFLKKDWNVIFRIKMDYEHERELEDICRNLSFLVNGQRVL